VTAIASWSDSVAPLARSSASITAGSEHSSQRVRNQSSTSVPRAEPSQRAVAELGTPERVCVYVAADERRSAGREFVDRVEHGLELLRAFVGIGVALEMHRGEGDQARADRQSTQYGDMPAHAPLA